MDIEELQSEFEPIPPRKHSIWYKVLAVISSLLLIVLFARVTIYILIYYIF